MTGGEIIFLCAMIFFPTLIVSWSSVGRGSSWAHPLAAALSTIAAMLFIAAVLVWHLYPEAQPSAIERLIENMLPNIGGH